MSKRKRLDAVDADESKIQDQALRIKVSRLKAKLDHGRKSLISALKLARGFERQKLGRRQKTASNEPHSLLRLREEVIVLKQLDMAQDAQNYLLKQLSRTKRIKESPAFIALYGSDPPVEATSTGAEANVLGRLFNAAPVKKVVPEIMQSVFSILGLPINPKDGSGAVKKSTSEQPPSEDANGFQDESFEGFSPNESDSDDKVSISEDSDQDAASISVSEEALSDSYPRSTENPRSVKPLTKTSFLPSLSMGGYYSGSESDEGETFDDAGAATLQVRKNRRGQRARQQIAEKKFGQRAKHLQGRRETSERDSGWDAKRGAIAQRSERRGYAARDRTDVSRSKSQFDRKKLPERPETKKRDDQGSLHPSWEAAKKRKMQGQGQAQFSGKKITFD